MISRLKLQLTKISTKSYQNFNVKHFTTTSKSYLSKTLYLSSLGIIISLGSLNYISNNKNTIAETQLQEVKGIPEVRLNVIATTTKVNEVIDNRNKIKFTKIYANILIPGKGNPIKNALVIIKNNKIYYVGDNKNDNKIINEINNIKENNSNNNNILIEEYHVNILMPGLWDCHVHFEGITSTLTGSMTEQTVKTPEPLTVGRSIHNVYQALNAGFTSLREVGGSGWVLKELIDEGSLIGPHIYHAGRALTMTAGHGDCHTVPYEWMCQGYRTVAHICDGIDECIKAVRIQLRKNASVIKIHASGGVMSKLDHPQYQQFNNDEMKVICDEAKRNRRIVAAHCHGKEGILAAIRNGVTTIEHGTYLDDECCQLIKQKNMILVPTRFISNELLSGPKPISISDESWRKAQEVGKNHQKALELAIKYNITIACGSDMFIPQWGRNGEELQYYVKGGMTTLQAIETCTVNGPKTIGEIHRPKSGEIIKGYDADLIALDDNPLENINILSNPNNIKMVWKDGKLVKSNGKLMVFEQ